MKLKKIARTALLFVLAAAMLGVVPAFATDEAAQADYELYVYAGTAEQGDVLTITAGESEYTYAVSTKAVRGLDLSDTRSYAGDISAVAGTEGMMLTLTDPACEGIVAEGNWKNSVDSSDVTVSFNGEELDFSGDTLELEGELGTITVNKDGSITFTANESTAMVTVSQNNGENACSVSLQRRMRRLPVDSATKVVLYERDMKGDKGEWVGVPLPAGMSADPEHLSWNQYVQFSIANGDLFCRQVKPFPFEVRKPIGGMNHKFVLVQNGGLTASGDWGHDIGNNKKVVRFNGAGHAYGTPDTVTDGIFALHHGRWYYTADDNSAGAFQFTSQQRGLELVAAVGRGNVPEVAAAGGETLHIESYGRNFTHTMQRLTHEEGNAPLTSELTVTVYVLP